MNSLDEVVEKGDTVRLHYTGRYNCNGRVFDTSIAKVAKKAGIYDTEKEYSPMEVVVGAGGAIKGIEEALIGMKLGEEKKVTVPAEKGYKNPEHPLHGKTLEFEIKVAEIFKSYFMASLEYYRA